LYLKEKVAADAEIESSSGKALKSAQETEQGTESTLPEKPAKSAETLMIPPFSGDIFISDGVLNVVYPDRLESSLLKDLSLRAHFAGPENRLEYHLSSQSGDSLGLLEGSGTLTVPSEGLSALEEIQSQAELAIKKWETRDLFFLFNHIADAPSGSGLLNGQIILSGSAATSLKIKGDLSTEQLKLQGGPLKSDTPSLDSVVLKIDAARTAESMTINQLSLMSALATAEITGTLGAQGEKEISSIAEINLEQLFAQFPSSLNLKEGTKVSHGIVDLSVNVRTGGTDTHFDGSARLDQLQGVAAGKKKLAWDTPVILEARGKQSAEGLQLDKFEVQSAFVNGIGKGDINSMKIQLTADIGDALKEIEKFIHLDGWKSGGKLALNLQVDTKSDELRSAVADVSISDFVLQQNERAIAPRNSFKANVSTDLLIDQEMKPQEMFNTTVDFASWIGNGTVNIKTLKPPSEKTNLQFGGLNVGGNFNLKHLTALLQTVNDLPLDTNLAGQAKLEAQGSFNNNQLQLGHVLLTVTEFVLSQSDKTIKEKQLKLATKGTIYLNERRVALNSVNLKSSSGEVTVSDLAVADWADLTKPIQANIGADVDVTRVSSMLGDFLPKKWAGTGTLGMQLAITSQEQQASSVTGNIKINNFSLKSGKQTIAPKGEVTASLSTQLAMDQAGSVSTLTGSTLNYKTWLGDGKMNLESLGIRGPQKQPSINGLVYDGSIDLSALSGLLKKIEMLPEDIRLAGMANIATKLSFEANKLELDQTTVNATDFLFQKGKHTLSEQKLYLKTRGSVNLEKKAAALKPFELETAAGRIDLPELVLNDWSNIQNGIRTNGTIDLDLARLTAFLGDILKLPEGTTVTGQTAITIDTDLSDAKHQFVKIDSIIKPFKLAFTDKKPLTEEKIQLMIDLKGNVVEKKYSLNRLELSSSPVLLNATGTVMPEGNAQVLTADGAMTLNLETVSSYLRSLTELDLEMAGTSEKPFSIKIKSLGNKWVDIPKRSVIDTSFHADTIRGFGLLVESLDVPLKLANGLAEIDIQGTVNRGKMSLKPAIDFSAEPPVISIPENNLVLADVGFSEEMSKDLLVQVHPIFIGAAVSQGTMDLGLRHFKWPLEAEQRNNAEFAGTITFKEVILRAGGLLTPLLEIMKVEGREITLGDQPIEFIGENDRIRCSPLEILIEGHSLMLSGSMGFNKSLDYVAQVPVTQRMVGGDAYKYLEGTFISVPIGGTVSKPSIRKDLVQTALKDLIIQAGKKQVTDQAEKLLQNLFK
jgi:hypothetical protein